MHAARLVLTERQRLDLEQILCGAFAPLTGFLEEKDYRSVVESMRLHDGTLWPIPILLDVPEFSAPKIGTQIILTDKYGTALARFTVQSIYKPNHDLEAELVYGTRSTEHPGVEYLMTRTNSLCLGGPVESIPHSGDTDFSELRFTPREMRKEFQNRGWEKVVAFQTRNPVHRAHYEVMIRAMREIGGKLLIHPVTGLTKEGDIDYRKRVRGYVRLHEKYLKEVALLAVLPIAMRMAGPREALWHALIRKNYGATHFIIGRDHAGPGKDSSGVPFYDRYAAQELAKQYKDELGIQIVTVPEMIYLEKEDRYVPADQVEAHLLPKTLSGTEFRALLKNGDEIPTWFSFPEVIEELRA